LGDVVLQWDAIIEEKGKHGKFENLWKGPYKISAFRGKNAFLLEETIQEGRPMIGLSSTTMSIIQKSHHHCTYQCVFYFYHFR